MNDNGKTEGGISQYDNNHTVHADIRTRRGRSRRHVSTFRGMLHEETKGTDCVVIMGDWTAVVRERNEGKEVGAYGLGKRNER